MRNNTAKTVFKIIFAVLAVLYAAAVFRIAFFRDGVRLETNTVHLMPFKGVQDYRNGLKSLSSLALNYLGNIALFFPLGIFLPVFFEKLNFPKTVLVGLLLSVVIEIAQYYLSCGYSDTDDVIMNTLGTAIGAILFFYIFRGKKRGILSYALSLTVILLLDAGSLSCVWYLKPNILPESMVVFNNMIAGKQLDRYDVRVYGYKMSHGNIFIDKKSAIDRDGNRIDAPKDYFIADTAVFVTKTDGKYSVIGLDDMIDAVNRNGGSTVWLWFNENEECAMVLKEISE